MIWRSRDGVDTGRLSRRTLLRVGGAGAVVAALAGCRDDRSAAVGATVPPAGSQPQAQPPDSPSAGTDSSAHHSSSEPPTDDPPATEPFATGPDPAEWSGPRADVQSIDNTFRPREIEVAPGTMVVWRNGGRTEHDILAVDGEWGVTPEDFPPGAEFTHVFTEPGEHPYYCTIHGNAEVGMVGTVIVTA